MNKLITILCFFIICSEVSSKKLDMSNINLNRYEFREHQKGDDKCVDIQIEFSKPFINKDCYLYLESYTDINIKTSIFDCSSKIKDLFCNFSHITFEVNDFEIKSILLDKSNMDFKNVPLHASEYMKFIDMDKKEACFTVKLHKTCTSVGSSEYFSQTKCIPLVKKGEQIKLIRNDGPVLAKSQVCLDEIPEFVVCNNESPVNLVATIELRPSKLDSNSVQIKLTDNNPYDNNQEIKYNFPQGFNLLVEGSLKNNKKMALLKSITIPKEENKCKSAVLILNYLTQYQDTYQIENCSAYNLIKVDTVSREGQILSADFNVCEE